MTLLRDIQEAAIDSNVPITSLLRRCKVLAARLGSTEFKNWIDNELNGYRAETEVPQYRVIGVNSKGHFSGPFQSELNNADIPLSFIPEKFRDDLRTAYLMEPIAALETLAAKTDSGTVREPWNPDLVAYVGRDIYQNMNCMQAWKVIPVNAIVAALDTVRTRILNFVLEIELEEPNAGEARANSTPVPEEKVTQIFNTYITGDVGNIATASTNVKQKAGIGRQNTDILEKILDVVSKSNEDEAVVARLCSAVEEMRDAKEPERFRGAYTRFMSVLADHIEIFGPMLAPYLPALSAMIA